MPPPIMNPRTIVVLSLALAALASATLSAIAFATFADPDLPAAWLFDASACVLVIMLGFTVKGGRCSVALLLGILAVCLPAAGPAVATLSATAIHFMRPAREEDERFEVGNPLTSNRHSRKPGAVLGRPLVDAVRRLSYLNLCRLLTGIRALPPNDARPVLLRLRDCDDAQLQLFAQGGLSDAIEAAEGHLKALARRARQHPDETPTHCAIAEINLHLLENHLVEEDDRPATWDAASAAIAKALIANPKDALSLIVCARLNLIGGDTEKATLAAIALAEIRGHAETAKLLFAEAAFEAGDFESVPEKLEGITPGAPRRDDILDFWRKPKPSVYA